MKIGFASLVGIELVPFSDLVRWSAKHGLESIEVNLGPTYPVIGDASFPGHLDPAAIIANGPGPSQELLAPHGVSIHALAPMINLLTSNLSLRDERIAYFRKTIEAATVLSVPTVVTFAGSGFGMHFYGIPGVSDGHESNRVKDNLRIFKEVYGPLAEFAGERGVRIAFETAGRGGPDGNIAHNPELWDAMFEAVPSTAVGLSFDPSHLVWLQIPNIPDVIRQYGSRIYHVDGKDIEILWGRLARQGILGSAWWRYRLPGMGSLDWPGIISALRDIGYDDVIAIENEDPLCPGLAGVAHAAEFLRRQLRPFGSAERGE
jgi:sugar phosphate isomerase/epimerase